MIDVLYFHSETEREPYAARTLQIETSGDHTISTSTILTESAKC